MKKLFLTILLLISFNVYAVDVGLYPTTIRNCVVPDARVDGTAFDWETEGKLIRFYWGTASGDYQNVIEKPNCQWIIDNTAFPPNSTIYITETAVDTDDRESGYNEETVHIIEAAVTDPKSPSGSTMTNIRAQ